VSELIDRRENGRHKSAVNRERFIRRYKSRIREAVRDMASERSIADMDKGGEVRVPVKDINEPTFRHGPGGDREQVFPGNREFQPNDRLPRPSGGDGEGGSEAGEGESVDDFVFTLSREEFLDIFFEDMELPRLERNVLGDVREKRWSRAGYVRDGAPCNLSVVRTLKTSIARRIAIGGPMRDEVDELCARLEELRADGADPEQQAALEAEIEALERRRLRIPFLDEVDLRYRHRVAVPMPVARAVMFCLMDVSSSMDESKKDLAKRFFTLLYLFLWQKYERVDLIFVRHTDDAEEVDENTFFHDPKSGGTVVLSALELMKEIVDARYPSSSWNIYAAQASDGDAFGADAGKSARFLAEELLPLTRYFSYVEIPDRAIARKSSLWVEYETVEAEVDNFAMRRVFERKDIFPVFRELFRKEHA
jgi:uncharacterized sporulation protein YeaH/YhbH (DUF444 family)